MKHTSYFTIFFAITLFLSSCYKENNPLDDLLDIQGDVAIVSSVTAPDNVPAGNIIELVIRCNALNTQIKEFKFYQRIGTSGAYTLTKSEPFVASFSETEKLHVVKVPYTVPNEPGKTFSLQVEAITDNDLVSARRTATPTNIKIK